MCGVHKWTYFSMHVYIISSNHGYTRVCQVNFEYSNNLAYIITLFQPLCSNITTGRKLLKLSKKISYSSPESRTNFWYIHINNAFIMFSLVALLRIPGGDLACN